MTKLLNFITVLRKLNFKFKKSFILDEEFFNNDQPKSFFYCRTFTTVLF